MARDFRELEAKMTPQQLAESDALAEKLMTEMLLAELRKAAGMTQQDLAWVLGVTQPNLSKIEKRQDMYISTLRRVVRGMGGELELIARMPDSRSIRLNQFDDTAATHAEA